MPKTRKPKNVLVSLMMPVDMKAAVERIAGKREQTFSMFVRSAVHARLTGRPVFRGTRAEQEQTAKLVSAWIQREARTIARRRVRPKQKKEPAE